MEVIPAVDIKDGKCVRLTQGDYNKEKIYNNSPLAAAKYWIEKGAKSIHLVDLNGAKDGKTVNFEKIKEITENIDIPIQLGGGIRSFSDMNKYFELGIDRLIVSTIALKNKELLKKALNKFGQDKIIVSLDIKEGKIAVKGWLETAELNPEEFLDNLIELGVKNIIFTDISSDGMLTGPDLEMINKLNREEIELIAAGGISTKNDLKKLNKIGIKKAVVGKALYEEKIKLEEWN
ncbi:MAG TPA: 1-(5-phosphoribosyl)-5-[(5-phosphoribosylamino)methylideneamino]imidazole-4-carboxamide isomerase [Halanaerobiales bacterium]|nr:1-(5-phosphoribosyl)-5-[(5-phosphoribosylamino)methylideneamino]imidazole-4-carboxamide isomerase [Halanaerobiales bacterium]